MHDLSTRYSEIKFKHVLLPVWVSAYRFRNKTYRFLVNGQTGEVAGESPLSWQTVTLLVIAIVVVILIAIALSGGQPPVSDNVFAPPKANLEREATEEAPALWNPNAAANWCLLFTAAFGAYLHMRNWQALGQPDRARASRNWMIAVIASSSSFRASGRSPGCRRRGVLSLSRCSSRGTSSARAHRCGT